MARVGNQKCKLLHVLKILKENTDEAHPMTMAELIDRLAEEGIAAERKGIYRDIAELTDFGYNIRQKRSRTNGGYYLAEREFQLPELKLLVDAVQASRFITLKKSRELIAKIEGLANRYDAVQLQRQVYVANRIKTGNESIYHTVDYIHRAMQSNRQISFCYFEWTVKKEMRFKRNGERYRISPWALTVKDENYYMAGYDSEMGILKHYRVDKMTDIRLEEEKRCGGEKYAGLDVAEYANKTFGMFGGEEETVTIGCADRLIGVIMDRFGTDVPVRERQVGEFTIRVKVVVSGQFFGWLTGLGKEARLLGPPQVVESYHKYLKELLENE
ncbi:MAG: WYL domain-containing protein [Clostridiales bacterium]|nr:WYL domain-containing protein [Clostridiales bacterium]